MKRATRAAARRNFHVPLSGELYERLRKEALRTGVPATDIARDAIRDLLTYRRRAALKASIAAYARRRAGGTDDLDRDLEAAAIDHLLSTDEEG
jgi:hypothetical protein